MRWQAIEIEHVHNSVNDRGCSTIMGQVPPGNSNTCGKEWRFIGREAVLIIKEDSGPCTVWQKTIQLFRSANIARLNLHIKQSTKCETVAKIQDTYVAKLWSNEHVYHRNLTVPWKCGQLRPVADLQGWPTSHVLTYWWSLKMAINTKYLKHARIVLYSWTSATSLQVWLFLCTNLALISKVQLRN